MNLLGWLFAESEERGALLDEQFKDCGVFRLGPFDRPDGRSYADLTDFLAAIHREMRRPAEFYSLSGDAVEIAESAERLTYTSVIRDGTANDLVSVDIVKGRLSTRRAVVIVPHWNGSPQGYRPFASAISWFGFDAFILTLPHHGSRASTSGPVANAFLNADVGSAIRSVRQSVLDVRRLIGWLEKQGYTEIHLLGASLGSCVAFLVTAFDPRVSHCVLLLTAGDFADTVWTGRATAHIRSAIEDHIDIDQLRDAWSIISPRHFAERFAHNGTRLLIVSGRRDAVVRFGLAREFAETLRLAMVDLHWLVFPCGHYSLSAFPFNIATLWSVLSFLRR